MQTFQASVRARSQIRWSATAMPSTQNGAERNATTNSCPWPARPIASAIATTAPPARLTAVGCWRSTERAAATRARIKRVVPSAHNLPLLSDPYTGSVPKLDAAGTNSWTCSRCEMTVSFAPDVEKPRLPTTWARENGELYCLACRRDMAGEAVDEDLNDQKRLQIRSQARIEFEIQRDPERADNEIAKACGTSTVAVRKARARLET